MAERFAPKAGRRYVRRDGTISPPLVRSAGGASVYDPETSYSFLHDNLVGFAPSHPKDLMYEYIEQHDAQPEPIWLGEWTD